MILTRIQCGLGNQMFQYAAGRTLAERLGCAHAYTQMRLKWTSHLRLGLTGRRLLLRAPAFEFERYFLLDGDTATKNQLRLQWFRLRYGLTARQYVEPLAPTPGVIRELTQYDPSFHSLGPGTELQGFFQSESYFAGHQNAVRRWFQPRPELLAQAQAVAANCGADPDRRCCIHVRRGDYLTMRNGGAPDGWALPVSYYRRALERIPSGTRMMVISDDPVWAREQFASLNPWIASHPHGAIVDMLLLTQCRYNIIANSSFSWWGSYLNPMPEKQVFYPKHFLGWAFQSELPVGISVADWTAIDV